MDLDIHIPGTSWYLAFSCRFKVVMGFDMVLSLFNLIGKIPIFCFFQENGRRCVVVPKASSSKEGAWVGLGKKTVSFFPLLNANGNSYLPCAKHKLTT
jgi:hypothetical protein